MNAALLDVADVIVTLPPLAVSVPEAVPLLPSVTLPTANVDGAPDNCPMVVVPSPDKARLIVEFEPLVLNVIVARNDPAALGANSTLNVALWPAAIETGRAGAVIEKYLLDTDAALTVADAPPEFLIDTVRLLLLPAVIVPKSRLAAPRARLAVGA